ncbi:MAG: hypothetical protein M0010_02165 [Actinomycetota bacterium]|nr:hypothetical protein [Actinomycetota bacterium]
MSGATVRCTGLTATWCPICGTCTCPADPQTGERNLDTDGCPLHDTSSLHGDPYVGCHLYARHGACYCSAGLAGPCPAEGGAS